MKMFEGGSGGSKAINKLSDQETKWQYYQEKEMLGKLTSNLLVIYGSTAF